jgi:O-antigen/teichoic acid export membrane protein
MEDLKARTLRGGVAKIFAQVANNVIRVGSLMIMARLLSPKDFGLVGMVTAFTGILYLFRDFGLSAATVQRGDVTEHQISTLFWVNLLFGVFLALATAALAPFAVRFYHEPRLFWVTIALGSSFLLNATGVQHSALLQRQLRFTALAMIDVCAWVCSATIGITLALAGFAYWSLVASTVSYPLVGSLAMWGTTRWIPGPPRRGIGLGSMMRFGGGLTLTSIIVYVAYNLEKVLLGRFWGADVVGLYGRAYQLGSFPVDSLNSAAGEVAFPALSRVRNDPPRLRSYFLKGYSLILAITVPITITVALFATDLIVILLGPKWREAGPIFRYLAPTILVFALINPIGWLITALGMIRRSLKVAMVLAPVVICGYLIGLPHGPKGVAIAYSTAMVLWVIPHLAWGLHGTVVSLRDVAVAASKPLASGVVAGLATLGVNILWINSLPPLVRVILGAAFLSALYVGTLFYVFGQKALYVGLVRDILGRSAPVQKTLVPA